MTNTTNMMSLAQFAFAVGNDRKAIKASAGVFHEAFMASDTKGQRAMRVEWMVQHIAATLAVTASVAEKIRAEGKGERVKVEHRKAIDCAYTDFRYYVVRPAPRGAKPSLELDVPAAVAAAAKRLAQLCAQYEGAKALAAHALKGSWEADALPASPPSGHTGPALGAF